MHGQRNAECRRVTLAGAARSRVVVHPGAGIRRLHPDSLGTPHVEDPIIMNTNKTWLVILDSTGSTLVGPCYLGEIDRGFRCGVRHIKNAVRFTETGARRVAAGFTGASIFNVGSAS